MQRLSIELVEFKPPSPGDAKGNSHTKNSSFAEPFKAKNTPFGKAVALHLQNLRTLYKNRLFSSKRTHPTRFDALAELEKILEMNYPRDEALAATLKKHKETLSTFADFKSTIKKIFKETKNKLRFQIDDNNSNISVRCDGEYSQILEVNELNDVLNKLSNVTSLNLSGLSHFIKMGDLILPSTINKVSVNAYTTFGSYYYDVGINVMSSDFYQLCRMDVFIKKYKDIELIIVVVPLYDRARSITFPGINTKHVSLIVPINHHQVRDELPRYVAGLYNCEYLHLCFAESGSNFITPSFAKLFDRLFHYYSYSANVKELTFAASLTSQNNLNHLIKLPPAIQQINFGALPVHPSTEKATIDMLLEKNPLMRITGSKYYDGLSDGIIDTLATTHGTGSLPHNVCRLISSYCFFSSSPAEQEKLEQKKDNLTSLKFQQSS